MTSNVFNIVVTFAGLWSVVLATLATACMVKYLRSR